MTVGGGARLQYAVPGLGGRTPVAYLGPAPAPTRAGVTDRPSSPSSTPGSVAHDWLATGARRAASLEPASVRRRARADRRSSTTSFQGPLDDFSGHGTFIAGLIRQTCPDAEILMVKVMDADGFVRGVDDDQRAISCDLRSEHLSRVLGGLDAVSMSFGYYHEEPGRRRTDRCHAARSAGAWRPSGVAARRLGRQRRHQPTDVPGRVQHRRSTLISVGARNPNGTVALFSNCGTGWTPTGPGRSGPVSTMPTTFDGSLEPTARTTDPWAGQDAGVAWTRTTSPQGFATWSGTSFAAPASLDDACDT